MTTASPGSIWPGEPDLIRSCRDRHQNERHGPGFRGHPASGLGCKERDLNSTVCQTGPSTARALRCRGQIDIDAVVLRMPHLDLTRGPSRPDVSSAGSHTYVLDCATDWQLRDPVCEPQVGATGHVPRDEHNEGQVVGSAGHCRKTIRRCCGPDTGGARTLSVGVGVGDQADQRTSGRGMSAL
jgi:hypothetical protein